MANPFSINVITSAGAALIAQATAANPIVYVDALTGTTAATDGADLATKTASWYDGQTGTIESSSATDSVARVETRFLNVSGSSAQIVKSVCVRGRLQLQSEGSEVIVAAMSDADSSIYIPPSTSPAQIIRFPFNIQIGSDDTIDATAADSASLSDLDRFVSLHAAGNPLTGERQLIRGQKTFSDTVSVDGRLLANGESVFDSDVLFNGDIEIDGDILPVVDDTDDIGAGDKRFHSGYIKTITNDTIFTNHAYVGSNEASNIGSAVAPYDDAYITNIHGRIPYASVSSSTLNLPVGGIVLAYIVNVSFGSDDLTGYQITIPSGSSNYKSVVFDGSKLPTAGSYSIPAGTYTCLGGGRSSSDVGSYMALMMRLS